MLKKLFVLLLVVMVLYNCGNNGQKRLNFAIVGKADTPYWNNVKIGAEASGKTLGASVRFYVPPKEDAAWQIKQMEDIIANKVDGIAFAASDTKTIAPVMMKAMQAGIPCIALDTDVAKSRHLYIGTGNYYAGQEAGQIMASLLEDNDETAILGNSAKNPDALERVIGFRDILAEYISLNVNATIDEDDSIIQSDSVESLLNSNRQITGLFCVSDSSSIAAAQAVQKLNKVGEIKIVSISESEDIMSFVRDGVIQAAVIRKPYRIGYLSVLALHNMARVGIENAMMIMPKSEMIDTGIAVIDASNIDQYREQLKELGIRVKF